MVWRVVSYDGRRRDGGRLNFFLLFSLLHLKLNINPRFYGLFIPFPFLLIVLCGPNFCHVSFDLFQLCHLIEINYILYFHFSPYSFNFRISNFATLDEETGTVISRRADRHFDGEGPVLCAALDGIKLPSFPEYEVRVRYATEHRCGVVVKGPRLSCNISGTDPLKDKRLLLQAEASDDTDEARHTAAVVNELSREISRILVSHPLNAKRAAEGKNIANVVLLRGCATVIARALSAPLMPSPNVFVPGEDEHKPGRPDGYDFGFLHIKVECRLRDFAGAVGGESIIMETSLDPFPLPAVKAGENLGETENAEKERSSKQLKAFSGDSVCELSEIAAARGCLGRFPGGQMMGIIKAFLELNTRAAPLRTSSWPGVLNKVWFGRAKRLLLLPSNQKQKTKNSAVHSTSTKQ
ncbi:2 bisphosphoglycerate-independent phosphoglycerate [Salix suchowensis]|nr:2 bisphosphoglycerate-independent phosphoglycerate [Salix suchowensis]